MIEELAESRELLVAYVPEAEMTVIDFAGNSL
jgi:hypothetical protein